MPKIYKYNRDMFDYSTGAEMDEDTIEVLKNKDHHCTSCGNAVVSGHKWPNGHIEIVVSTNYQCLTIIPEDKGE